MLYHGDCLDVMPALLANSVDTIITDPPYGLSFMGKSWDHGVPGVPFWEAALRVAKPGAMLLAFGGTRTYHRLTCAIEDAGWEIRDCLMWLYGSGFPKSHDISKAIDKAAGAERPRNVVPEPRSTLHGDRPWMNDPNHRFQSKEPVTDLAKEWNGWGTALKPAWEPIILAMKPLDGTFAQNAERHGVAGLNIEASRVGTEVRVNPSAGNKLGGNSLNMSERGMPSDVLPSIAVGRWPANLLLDDAAAAQLGEPSRFFYCAKASPSERNAGLDDLPLQPAGGLQGRNDGSLGKVTYSRNSHPTVKPLALMEYLCRLTATPTGGTVLDPFMGSGSTGVAAVNTGRDFIGIELDEAYHRIAVQRIEKELNERDNLRLPGYDQRGTQVQSSYDLAS